MLNKKRLIRKQKNQLQVKRRIDAICGFSCSAHMGGASQLDFDEVIGNKRLYIDHIKLFQYPLAIINPSTIKAIAKLYVEVIRLLTTFSLK
jgi:hypothetical protein